jgi:hypothetical protein
LLALLLTLALALASTSLATFRGSRQFVFVVRATAAVIGPPLRVLLTVALVGTREIFSPGVVSAPLAALLLVPALLVIPATGKCARIHPPTERRAAD